MTHIQKWGNSLAVRLPKAFADQLSLSEGSAVDVVVEDGRLVIKPRDRHRPTLEALLASCHPEDRPETVDWGQDVGHERID